MILLFGLSGCTTLMMDVPDGFVLLADDQRGQYDIRAVSADGVVVAACGHDNAQGADAGFWATAITRELTETSGYQSGPTRDVTSASGEAGKLLSFTQRKAGADYAYWLAVFTDDGRVLVSEAGGEAAKLAPRQQDIEKAMLSVR
jgi:hypothetical protein